jgi:hypothetical protein
LPFAVGLGPIVLVLVLEEVVERLSVTSLRFAVVTMKWSHRTAHGFSPGKAPVLERPERAIDLGVSYGSPTKLVAAPEQMDERTTETPFEYDNKLICKIGTVSAALSGRILLSRHPGLKPWAVFLDHLMAWKPLFASLPSPNK